MQASEYEDLIQQVDALLKQGQGPRAVQILNNLKPTHLPGPFRLRIANLCRRAGLIHLGLRVLNGVVNPDKVNEAPSAKERAAYAALLQKNSSLTEALGILKGVDTSEAPEALLYQAFCNFSQWEYEAAIPLLNEYRAACESPYEKLIADVNLASALISCGQWSEAKSVLELNLAKCSELGADRLAANCCEMRAQVHMHTGDLGQAQDDLNEAQRLLGAEATTDQLFVLKWNSILEAQKSKSCEPLEKFKKQALERNHGESVREADLHMLKIKFDRELFLHLYFGTPFAGYRRRLARELGEQSVPDQWQSGSGAGLRFELATGHSEPPGFVKPGDKIHQLLNVLWKDFYQPARLGTLFAELFPGEHFNVLSSPGRLHQLLKRSRQQIAKAGFPVLITDVGGAYKITCSGPVNLIFDSSTNPVGRDNVLLLKLKSRWGSGYFSSHEATEVLAVSPATAQRLLRRGVEAGIIHCAGDGPARRYSLAS